MLLTQLKIRGLGEIPETCWIPVKPRITIVRINDRMATRQLIRAIQTINPPYDCREEMPFNGIRNEIVTDAGHKKRIEPSKRTIAFAVFNSPPSLVTELGTISETLYETDRIEIGRRLDYSRWINFVELASSSRWSEVSADIQTLMTSPSSLSATQGDRIRCIIRDMKSSDRIKGETMQLLNDWLTGLRDVHRDIDRIDSVIEKIIRVIHFSDARRVIKQRLPLFQAATLQNGNGLSEQTGHKADQKKSSSSRRFPPVMLIDLLDYPAQRVNQLLESLSGSFGSGNQFLCFVPELCQVTDTFDQYTITENAIMAASEPAHRPTR